jgi:hypothetical protein
VQVLWGGFSVDNPTLQRFYSVHYVAEIFFKVLRVSRASSQTLDPPSKDIQPFSAFMLASTCPWYALSRVLRKIPANKLPAAWNLGNFIFGRILTEAVFHAQ